MFDPNLFPSENATDQGALPARDIPSLSPTEKRVCSLLLQRLTEQRIAEHLDRSPNTVHVHVRNIYRKLGVRTRKQLYEFPGIVSMVISKD
ncbi:MAG: helix-turn-helix transcriptional regulator [Planctomycetota bacterium]